MSTHDDEEEKHIGEEIRLIVDPTILFFKIMSVLVAEHAEKKDLVVERTSLFLILCIFVRILFVSTTENKVRNTHA